ncbi:MAG TPA: glutamate-5-semialdehyde dehydrogenase [Methanomassiliicoccales archaeon]|jgi:glutamate-5-semialdehyde dehydrogenase
MDEVRRAAERAKLASLRLQSMPAQVRNRALNEVAISLKRSEEAIVEANQADLRNAERINLATPLLKRLKYDHHKIEESIAQIESLIQQDDPIGRSISKTELDDGLILNKVTTPIGVVAVIFESRPDALVQISTLCIKSGNAVILKGGSEAKETNSALAKAIVEGIMHADEGFKDSVQLLSTREEVKELLDQDDLVDLIIPRGSNQLVRSIQDSTRIPVLGHAAGVCHTYVDKDADVDMAVNVAFDAKCQYPAVCNAMETLLVHEDIAKEFLPRMAKRYSEAHVEIRGDEKTRQLIEASPATEDDWNAEYNDLVLSVKTVSSLEEAVDHINRHGSHHTDAIITQDEGRANRFMDTVDSASVLWNCSTRFADGFRYGLGAEVGISTNKTHARGPVGLEGLVIYKYRLSGKGQVVADYADGTKQFTHRKIK